MKRLFLAAITAILFTIVSCNGAENNDPKVVLSQFFEALSKNDMATAKNLSTAESKSLLDLIEMAMNTDSTEMEKFDISKMQFGKATIEGDKATVPVTETTSGENMQYTLKKEKGAWKVAFDKNSIMSMGMDKMKEEGVNVADSITNVLDQLKNIDTDSLKKTLQQGINAMDSGGKDLKKLQ